MEVSSTVISAQSKSVWASRTEMPLCPRLTKDSTADVCIIGAGIAGLTTGYLLTKVGQRVIIIDDGKLANDMTQFTTAHLSSAIDDGTAQIERWHGREGARISRESVTDALYWDTDPAYHYVRIQPMQSAAGHNGGYTAAYDLLIIGGEDHKTGQAGDTDQCHDRLLQWALSRFPMIEGIEFTWGGQVMETMDRGVGAVLARQIEHAAPIVDEVPDVTLNVANAIGCQRVHDK